MKDINTRQAIGVPKEEKVINVNMGDIKVISDNNNNEHLLTFGLGPCVGIAIVFECEDGQIIRMLAHMDIGQNLGIKISDISKEIEQIKNNISGRVNNVKISLTSTDSYKNMNSLNPNEMSLIVTLLKDFKEYGITFKDIKINNGKQVQISPKGQITSYSNEDVEIHRKEMDAEAIRDFGGRIDNKLNIYITKYGAYMGNCSSLKHSSTKEEIEEYLSNSKYYKEKMDKGYELVVAPSFNDSDSMAIYLKNWENPQLQNGRTIPGCIQASRNSPMIRDMSNLASMINELKSERLIRPQQKQESIGEITIRPISNEFILTSMLDELKPVEKPKNQEEQDFHL